MKNHSRPPVRKIDDVRPQASVKAEVHHIPVGEAVEVKTGHSPLSAYMVNSKYIDPNAAVAPKRPLGVPRQTMVVPQRTQTAFYSRVPGYATDPAGLTDRIRRSGRLAPLAAAPMGASMVGHHDDRPALSTKASAAIAAFFLLIREKLIFVKDFLAKKTHHFHVTHPRIHYSALHGAMVKKFGMRDSWAKLAAPLFIFACLLATVTFSGLIAPGRDTSNPAGNGTSSTDSSRQDDGQSGGLSTSTGPATTPLAGSPGSVSPQSSANGGGDQLQPTVPTQTNPTVGLPVGGRGGDGPATPTSPVPTGTVTPTQPTPTPPSDPEIITIPPPSTLPDIQVEPLSPQCPCEIVGGAVQRTTGTLQATTETVDTLTSKP